MKSVLASSIGLLLGSSECLAEPAPPRSGETTHVRGTVTRLTTAPRGETDGAVLDNGTLLHWPPHLQERFSNVVQAGDRIEAVGRTETAPKGEVQFEVEKVTNLRTNTTVENAEFDKAPPPPPRRRGRPAPPHKREQSTQVSTVHGIAQKLTNAPKGEVDGVVLEDGTRLHWPPHLGSQFSGAFKIGDAVDAVGYMETLPRGETQLEVQRLTNPRTNTTVKNPDLPDQTETAASAPERSVDRQQALKELQEQIDRLQRELDRLRNEK
jgi:hypothetical protein